MAIDIMPRTAIVLLPVVGLQMAVLRGSALISPVAMVVAWTLAIAWLAFRLRKAPQWRIRR